MKAAFEILRAKPKIFVVLTRDSVCAGDDCDAPHEKKIEVHSLVDPGAFRRLLQVRGIISIQGRIWNDNY